MRFLLWSCLLIASASATFWNPKHMSTSWTFPYFSGAKNSPLFGAWRISPSDYEIVKQLPYGDYDQYKHRRTSDTQPHAVNNTGYIAIAKLAQLCFPFLGDLVAVRIIQVIAHILLCLLILACATTSTIQRLAFLCLYGINPIVIQVVTYPFYYFWACIPSAVLLYMWSKTVIRWPIGAVGVALVTLSVAIRPTSVLLAIWAGIMAAVRTLAQKSRPVALIGCTVAVVCIGSCFIVGTSSPNRAAQFAHSRFIGLGAYGGTNVIDVEDAVGFAEFRRRTGIKIDTNPVSGNWGDPTVSNRYAAVMGEAWWDNATPSIIVRNAILNLLQSFSVGYPYRSRGFAELSAALGCLTLLALACTGQWRIVIAICANYATFGWFYPPIPNYMFGAYILIAFGWSMAINQLASILCRPRTAGEGSLIKVLSLIRPLQSLTRHLMRQSDG